MAQAVLKGAPPRLLSPRPAFHPRPRPAPARLPLEAPDSEARRRLRRVNVVLALLIAYAAVSLAWQLCQGCKLYRAGLVLTHEWAQERAERQHALQVIARADRPEELERLARERLGFVGPDEVAVKLFPR